MDTEEEVQVQLAIALSLEAGPCPEPFANVPSEIAKKGFVLTNVAFNPPRNGLSFFFFFFFFKLAFLFRGLLDFCVA